MPTDLSALVSFRAVRTCYGPEPYHQEGASKAWRSGESGNKKKEKNRTELWMRQGGAGRSYGPTGGKESPGTTEQDKMSLCHKGARGNEEG